MHKKSIPLLFIVSLLMVPAIIHAQVTTSNFSGTIKVTDVPLIGASVRLTNEPTGTIYTTTTAKNGRYIFNNIQPGGPYAIEISYAGYEKQKRTDLYFALGESGQANFDLKEKVTELSTVVVSSTRVNRQQPIGKGGVETIIGADKVQNAPSVGRNLADFFRLVPQAKTTFGGGISIAGQNNRYNQLMIDGATNNDNFGLSDQGTNGGQTGSSPVSIDAIEAFQIGISPYDVSLGNFTGGTINAITKSGTNNFTGSAYYVYRNQNLAGKTPTGDKSAATKLPDFSNKIFGFTAGGAFIKNKLFFFVSGEKQDATTPQPFDPSNFRNPPGIQAFTDTVGLITQKLSGYGYDPGAYLNIPDLLKSTKLATKITWNINSKHRLNVSYRYTKSERSLTTATTSSTVNFFNGGYFFPSTTNSGSLELTSTLAENISNKLLVTYTAVFDDRNPLGANFPRVIINSVNGSRYQFGSENFSNANQLKQNNFNIYDELKWTLGQHQLKAGIDIEWSKSYNLFIRDAYGTYTYGSANAFLNDLKPTNYSRNFSNVDNIIGDGSAAAPTFKTLRAGAFIGDEWVIGDHFKLNYGIRFDNFQFVDNPNEDTYFNTTAIPAITQFFDLDGARSGQKPNAMISAAPRIGFNYAIPEENIKFRGGIGLFTGRVPLVWPGGVYNNSGITIGGVNVNNPNITFRPDVYNQYSATDLGQSVKIPSGQIDLIAKDFKLPKVLKASIGFDKSLGKGFTWTTDFLFQKNINEVIYRNVYGAPGVKNLFGQDVYFIPGTTTYNKIDMDPVTPGIQNPYSTGIFLITNAKSKTGFSYNFSTGIDKSFSSGWAANISYVYGDSYAIFDGTSSQNNSQWRFMESSTGRNNLQRSRSHFSQLHRINAYVSKKFEYLNKNLATTISLFYNGQSGSSFSYVYQGSLIYDQNGSNSETTDLVYIPKDFADWSRFAVPYTLSGTTVSVQQQWNALNTFIQNDPYLRNHRGSFADRSGSSLPFSNQVDLQVKQDFVLNKGKSRNTLTVQLDMFNFTNFLNRDWGRVYTTPGVNTFSLMNMTGYTVAGGIYQPKITYTNLSNRTAADVLDVRSNAYSASRWRGQVTIRYTFK
jgi:hypothetical protein